MTTQDFLNEADKVDGLYLGIRLNLNAVNIVTILIILKIAVFNMEKINKMRKIILLLIVFNFCLLLILGLLHLRVRHVLYFSL